MNRRSIPILLLCTLLLATACNAESETIIPIITESGATRTQVAETDPTPVLDAQTPTVPESTEIQVDLAARVNGEGIPLAVYQAELERFRANSGTGLATYKDEIVLETLIDQVLLAQSARDVGYLVSEENLESRIQGLGLSDQALDDWIETNGYTQENFRSALELSIQAAWMRDKIIAEVPETAEQVHARQILLYNSNEAEAIYDQLVSGADFETLAAEIDPVTRGMLGWFPRGYLTVPELDDVLFSLEIGAYSPVIQTALGYHIVQVLERSLDHPLTVDARRVLQTRALAQWLENGRSESEILILLP